ncbi:hypothetical protein G6O67_000895 [Ophiocordyceps sinensis]|uniref:Transmembrane protein n=1 Tax=Ophiocordyceps sinensis TaxID=72228 RepID=A0A8H4VA88_9HYPO|nr:hypothetical protein G6O67_000895 [Ophiocordyceps sinensis]
MVAILVAGQAAHDTSGRLHCGCRGMATRSYTGEDSRTDLEDDHDEDVNLGFRLSLSFILLVSFSFIFLVSFFNFHTDLGSNIHG